MSSWIIQTSTHSVLMLLIHHKTKWADICFWKLVPLICKNLSHWYAIISSDAKMIWHFPRKWADMDSFSKFFTCRIYLPFYMFQLNSSCLVGLGFMAYQPYKGYLIQSPVSTYILNIYN